jgi:hypothetical protein
VENNIRDHCNCVCHTLPGIHSECTICTCDKHEPIGSNPISLNYLDIVPNSHWFSDLDQIISSVGYMIEYRDRDTNPKQITVDGKMLDLVYVSPEHYSLEYLLTGLKNSKNKGYELNNGIYAPYKGDYFFFKSDDHNHFDVGINYQLKNLICKKNDIEIFYNNKIETVKIHNSYFTNLPNTSDLIFFNDVMYRIDGFNYSAETDAYYYFTVSPMEKKL